MIVEYQALDTSGTIVSDTLTVNDTGEACMELKRRGLTPIRVQPGKVKAGAGFFLRALLGGVASGNIPDGRKASRKELPFFTTQVTILLETGTPIASSLRALESQFKCPHWAALIGLLRQHVEEGSTLAAAMAQFPNVFDQVYTNMVGAGEMSGNLDSIFKRLAAMARQSERLRSKVIAAMIYPVLLTSIAMGVMGVLTFFVLPRFESVFEEMNVDLPGSTKALLNLSNTVRNNVLVSILTVVGVIAAIIYWTRTAAGQRTIMRNSVRLPLVGKLVSSIHIARIMRLLGLLVDSSIPLLESLELTGAATKNYLFTELVDKMRKSVIDGRPMYPALEHCAFVTPGIGQMVRTGEENSRIGMIANLLADHLDDDNETKVNTLTSILEPVILIVMGVIVGIVALSLVLPMFDLSSIG